MAEPVPPTIGAAANFNPASNTETTHGHTLPDGAHDRPSADGYNEKNETFPDSSNASSQLKPGSGSDRAINVETNSDVANEKAPSGDKPVRKITGIKWFLVVLSILSSTFLFALDNTVVADIQPKIVDRFGEIQKLPWLPIAFLVACVSTNLIWYDDRMLRILIPADDLDLQGEDLWPIQC